MPVRTIETDLVVIAVKTAGLDNKAAWRTINAALRAAGYTRGLSAARSRIWALRRQLLAAAGEMLSDCWDAPLTRPIGHAASGSSRNESTP
jgi:hypothetical protein